MYADIDFFLALLKGSDWLKASAAKMLEKHKNDIETSETTFVELMLLSHKHRLDPVQVAANILAITKSTDTIYLTAAYYIKENSVSVFDAFHAAHAGTEIISSDRVYDRLGLKRAKLEEQ